MRENEDAALELNVFGQQKSSMIDTDAMSLWIGQACFKKNGGQIGPTQIYACTTDCRDFQVTGRVLLDFPTWGVLFSE